MGQDLTAPVVASDSLSNMTFNYEYRGASCVASRRLSPWRDRWVAAVLVLSLSPLACRTDRPANEPGAATAAAVVERRCSKCHDVPDPGRQPREKLEAVLSRHRSRVHLAEGEWTAILDYLAGPSGATRPTQLDR
jgi:hypothetical protein